MLFKHHLAVIIIIIGIVFAVWLFMNAQNPPAALSAPNIPESTDGRYIQIIRASWALNCARYKTYGNNAPTTQSIGNFADTPQQKTGPKENNVFPAVSRLCDKKLRCEIKLSPETLGGDPAPRCFQKELEVEYRCFTFDRLWRTTATSGTLTINCDNKGGQP